MKTNWTFYDGFQKHQCDSFPYAYRTLFNTLHRALKAGGKHDDLTSQYKITSPFNKVYNYKQATQLAKDQGLLTTEGTIKGEEFKGFRL